MRWTSASVTSTSFVRQSIRLRAPASWAPYSPNFLPASRTNPDSRDYLEWLLSSFRDYLVAVELRHRSWSDDHAAILEMLRTFNAAWAQIDEPKFRDSIRQKLYTDAGAFYYLRLHGRNAAQWWKHEKSEDRYNYLYSAEELEPFAEAAEAAHTR